ncbi:TPA: helix-turn-helix transcriptional regulator [Pseudomonas aeruginosa]|uniref:helix-turn-helix domain-containing protein n=1 Tax=Pseudomonas aeruginosa TaxID=287 RepID=UPI001298710D|nr:helix-turn-helix transcriptional regulator [Pseudomonas aeruginosa]MBG4456775.1 helix-turn-helix transcriptional regulator [Pseudomonas aeruginosa]MBG7090224.1 helix-turn-helix transcriptional regulator [Pseudomonas aeruginosa]MCW5465406.1 helix-turn-helix transcriptional regulator [Pseudomonas aeruginosa]MWW60738.1 helix-turn-helix domain-containing protein [Pseudomonas aeruginosa]
MPLSISQTHNGINPFWDNPELGLLRSSSFHCGRPSLTSTYSDSYQLLLTLLIQARKNARVTQAELALRLDKPQSFISKYERGERRLDVVEFLHVCEQICADPHEIIQKLLDGNK